ncbi:MAG TPA: LexA family transcriptional regulator [Candidatus Woesebacteria bacterium]|nr:LexA family transcriptional regulator [Candidatus Woesebacteria bacterium]
MNNYSIERLFSMHNDYLNKLKEFYFGHYYIPSYKELCKLFNVSSTQAVAYWVDKWKEQGYLTSHKEKLMPTPKFFEFPLLGSIQAGFPTEQYDIAETLMLNPFNFKHPTFTYLLKVKGDSMVGAGIMDGDLVVIDKKIEPQPGFIVAAFIDNEWTLKYFRRKEGTVYLEAANPNYKPMFPKQNLEFGGVVIKVIREYI